MGTLFFADRMMRDGTYEDGGIQRQVEVFRPSGEEYLVLRIGERDEQHMGRGYAVKLFEEDARELLSGLLRGMFYFGYKTDDLLE